ncbi:CCR4-NOT transcription complex subunit regena isoform X1 [Rhodnius prolixus]|uniref:Putative ccr4-not transcription complex subunit 2 n=1 Tax=Rhodnius neglectus TaxID=72488 RepID=A0A0P4VVI1_9HEMI
MANLNFQQPPRSIAGQGLSRGGFGTSSLSGHVTPTSGIFAPGGGGGGGSGGGGSGGSSSSFTPQQLSPSRGLSAITNRGLFPSTQRTFPDRRQVPGLGSVIQDWSSGSMSSMANFGMAAAAAAAASRSYVNSATGGSGSSGGASASSGLTNFHVFTAAAASASSGTTGGASDHTSAAGSTPPLLDLSEFPSLTNRGGQGESLPQPSTLPAGKQPYVGMVKQPTAESSEFTMSSEDFPALPGTGSEGGTGSGGVGSSNSSGGAGGIGGNGSGGDKSGIGSGNGGVGSEGTTGSTGAGVGPGSGNDQQQSSRLVGTASQGSSGPHQEQSTGSKQAQVKRGIQTSPDGMYCKVTNIPNSMVKDQFGMVGLLTFIRAAETDPNLVSLALGQDLTALGLNLNSQDNLYPTFGGPWAETPCRAQDIDYHVPPEYIINHSIRDKLAQLKLTRYKEDLLFFMYYTNAGDMLQLAAAAELYSREWRYHMEEKVWITQAPGCGVIEKTSTYERGTYYFFDAQNWRKVAKEFYLDYSKLENQPSMPTLYHSV